MEKLEIPATSVSPRLSFIPEEALFRISGNSLPEDASGFYTPILEWLQKHVASLPANSSFEFSLPYFNSSSMKGLYTLLLEIRKGIEMGKAFKVVWYVDDEDEFMVDAGETFMELTELEIEIRQGVLDS